MEKLLEPVNASCTEPPVSAGWSCLCHAYTNPAHWSWVGWERSQQLVHHKFDGPGAGQQRVKWRGKWIIKGDNQNRIKAVKIISSLAFSSSLNSSCMKQPKIKLHVKIKMNSPCRSAGAGRCFISNNSSPCSFPKSCTQWHRTYYSLHCFFMLVAASLLL